MRSVITVMALAIVTSAASAQDTLVGRIKALEDSNASIAADLKAIKSDLAAVKSDLADVRAAVKELNKAHLAADPGGWGGGVASPAPTVTFAAPMAMYGTGAGAGSCASGSCGSSAGFGRVGLFGRLRGR